MVTFAGEIRCRLLGRIGDEHKALGWKTREGTKLHTVSEPSSKKALSYTCMSYR